MQKLFNIKKLINIKLIQYPFLIPIISIAIYLSLANSFISCSWFNNSSEKLYEVWDNPNPSTTHHDVIKIEKYRDATYITKTIYYYNDGTTQVALPMGYPKDGPFYSSGKKPIEIIPDNNETCENAHYNQKEPVVPVITETQTPPGIIMGKHNPNTNPNLMLETINLVENIRNLDALDKAIKIREFWYNQIAQKIQDNNGVVNLRKVVYESIKNPVLHPFWLVEKDTGDFLSNNVAANIMGLNIEDIRDPDVPNDAKIVLSHINVQISLCNLAESKHRPHIDLVGNNELYKRLLKENHNI